MKLGLVLLMFTFTFFLTGGGAAQGTGYDLNWSYLTGGWVRGAAVSGDGNYVAAGSQDTYVYLFNKSGDRLWRYKTRSYVSSVALSKDGSLLAAGSDDTNLYFFDRHGVLWLYDVGSKGVELVSISDDGAYVAASSDDRVFLFNNKGGRGSELWNFKISGVVYRLYLSPTGDYVTAQSRDRNAYFFDRNGFLWSRDLETVDVSKTFPKSDSVFAAFSRYNSIFVFNKEGTLRWTAEIEGGVKDISILANGSLIAVHTGAEEIHLYSNEGNLTTRLSINGSIRRPSLSDDGSYLAAGFERPDENVYFFLAEALKSQGNETGQPQKQKIVVLANSIDLGMAADFLGFLENQDLDVVLVNAPIFDQYKNERYIIILGGPDAPEGVGEIAQEALNDWEEGAIRRPGSMKLYSFTDVWSPEQKVIVIAGFDREHTRAAHEDNRERLISELGL